MTAPDQTHGQASDGSIRAGSKSFALASRLFAPPTRVLVWDLYTWCRHCDDVVDGQVSGQGHDPHVDRAARVADLRQGTDAAFAGQAGAAGPFAALQRVVRATDLPVAFTRDHLDGFAMDAAARHYDTFADTLDYCYHVAGVVGLMMGWVMGVRDAPTLRRACDLGIAFQLTNIARDVGDDAAAGRIYLPARWLDHAQVRLGPDEPLDDRTAAGLARVVSRLLDEADAYYRSARYGVPRLPWRSAWAVATASHVYGDIGVEVRRRGAHAWRERVVTGTPAKVARALQAAFEATWATTAGTMAPAPARHGLFTPPALVMRG
ncbi:MAG: phytoene/squalene synthase family protein [Acidobacteriota bacterium]